MNVSLQRAAEIAGVNKTTIAKAVRAGKILASHLRDGQVLVHPNSLDAWIEKRFHEEGGTHDPAMISLREASELVKMRHGAVTDYVKRGTLSTHTNPAGRFILDRQEFEQWRASLPPLRQDMDPSVRYYTFQEIADLVGLNLSVVASAAEKGEMRAIPCRTPYHSFVVEEAEVKRWLQERSKKFPQAELHGERLSLEAAARLSGMSPNGAHAALVKARLKSKGRDGQSLLYPRKEIERWLLDRFHQQGETLGSEQISLRDAAQATGRSVAYLRAQIAQGKLARQRNPAGELVLSRRDLDLWLEVRGPAPTRMKPEVRYTSAVELAEQLGLNFNTVHRHIHKGALQAVRGPKGAWMVSDEALAAWKASPPFQVVAARLRART